MADILHDFTILTAPGEVWDAVTSPSGIASWWSKKVVGEPKLGATYAFYGEDEIYSIGVVKRFEQGRLIEWEITKGAPDCMVTRMGFKLADEGGQTLVSFHHTGWPEVTSHFRERSFRWALDMRLLKRYVELGEVVRFEERGIV